MAYFTSCITFGFIILVLPLAGLPVMWEQTASAVFGGLTVIVAWRGRRMLYGRRRSSETFVERDGAAEGHSARSTETANGDE